MKVLLVGGSGYVGRIVTPYMTQEHEIRVLDLRPPQDSSVEYVSGSAHDLSVVRRALDGVEGVIYMAMGKKPDGSEAHDDIDLMYDLNVKEVHRVLRAATEASVARAVYVSTVSVHWPRPNGAYETEAMPCDAPGMYGFTKWLGELVCDYFARVHGLPVVALRLYAPVTREEWHGSCQPGLPNLPTAAPDVARAFSLALSTPLTGFHVVFISGDYEGKHINCSNARELLGWEPLERPARPLREAS